MEDGEEQQIMQQVTDEEGNTHYIIQPIGTQFTEGEGNIIQIPTDEDGNLVMQVAVDADGVFTGAENQVYATYDINQVQAGEHILEFANVISSYSKSKEDASLLRTVEEVQVQSQSEANNKNESIPLMASKECTEDDCSLEAQKDEINPLTLIEGKRNPPQEENKTAQHQPCKGAKKEQPLEVDQSVMLLLQQLQVTTMCVLHPDCPVEYYCGSHDVNCCQVCASQLHQDCENIDKLDRNCHKFIQEDIEEIKLFLSEVEKMLNKETTSISKTKQEARDFLSKVKILINAKQEKDSIFQNVQEKVDRSLNKGIYVHNDRISVLQKLKKQIHDCLKILESKLSPVQRKIAWKAVLNLTQAQVDKSLKTLTSDILEMKMTICKEFNTTRFDVSTEPKKSEVSEFVSLCSDILDTLFIHMSNKPMMQIVREPLITCDISFVASAKRSNIQAGDFIPEGTYLPNNTILLCDSHNKQLIKLDENLGFLEKLPVAGEPLGVCVSSDGNRVHVVCDGDKVVSYTLQGPWREVHRFGTESNAWGIACHGDRIVTGHRDYVVIYDSTGTKLSRINTSGESVYPALSHDGRMLYHRDDDDVVCRSMEDVTQEVWRYSSQELYVPLGIDTDRDGNILIVGGLSHNVHQVSGDGKINRILVNKMKYMKWSFGLFTNRNNNTFCVTTGSWVDKVCCVEMYRFDD